MIEAYEDDWLVRVRAQVMCRDDCTGGWVPLGGGGLSNVMVRKRPFAPNNLEAIMQEGVRVPARPIPSHRNPPPVTTSNTTNIPNIPNINTNPNTVAASTHNNNNNTGSGNNSNGSTNGHKYKQADWKPVEFVVPTVVERDKTPTISSVWGDRREGLAQRYSNWRVWWRGECKVAARARRRSQRSKSSGGSGTQLEKAGQRVDNISHSATDSGGSLKYEYFIHGKRISDQSVVLLCTLKKDFQYNKVMPTFHHWTTDEKRFGLTFQTAADARAFDRGVRVAVDDLLDGMGGAWPSLYAYKKHNPAPPEEEDDNIFECLNLPSDSRSSSENSTASRSHQRHQQQLQGGGSMGLTAVPPRRPTSQQSATSPVPVFHLEVRQPNLYTDTMSLSPSARELLLKKKLDGSCSEVPPMFEADPLTDNYSYVQLTQVSQRVHEYVYPSLGTGVVTVSSDRSPSQGGLQRRDSGSSLKKRAQGGLYSDAYRPTLGGAKRDMAKKPQLIMEGFHNRLKCRHCQEWYMESSNRPGSCEYAPDDFKSCINTISGIKCAQCMLYHCMADAEGEFANPCACNVTEDGCSRRWLGLALLSILVPCLWCYPPLKAVHWCCVGCGVTGGRHTPVQRSLHAYH